MALHTRDPFRESLLASVYYSPVHQHLISSLYESSLRHLSTMAMDRASSATLAQLSSRDLIQLV
ncbi:hypothetical protein ES708_02483 [subsurface metagenome]